MAGYFICLKSGKSLMMNSEAVSHYDWNIFDWEGKTLNKLWQSNVENYLNLSSSTLVIWIPDCSISLDLPIKLGNCNEM